MRTWEKNQYEVLVRVRDFWDTHRHLFPESMVSVSSFATIVTAVDALSDHVSSSTSVAWEGRRVKRVARAELLARLTAIGRTARIIAEDAPGFADSFRLPKQRTEQALLTAGRAFVNNLEPEKARFVGHGLPETFVADLKALVDTFEQTIRERETGKTTQATAQAGIASALLSGLAAVRQLDVIVLNQLAGDPAGIAGWERDRRVEYPSRRAKTTTAEPVPAAGAPPSIGSGRPAPAAPPAAA